MRRLNLKALCAACAALCLSMLATAGAAGTARLAAQPQRIVSLNLCTDQIVLQLVPRERIAALSWLSQRPESAALHQQAQGLRTVRGSAEEVLALQPDLVLVGTATTRHTTRLLQSFGVRTLALPGADSFAQVKAQIRTVAAAVGEAARGEAVVAVMEAQARAIATAHNAPANTARQGTRPVAIAYWAGGRSAGRDTLYEDILTTAGYANGATQAGMKGYAALPLERLVASSPNVIVTNDYKRGAPTLGNRLLKHPALLGTGAQEVRLPSRITVCGGPWNIDAAALLAREGSQP